MRSIAPAASATLVALSGSAGALAQDVAVELYGGEPYYYEYTEPAPRAYRGDPPAVAAPVRPPSCGEFRYWNGQQCVDARFVPPDVR
jgi:hypothetical protein